jgi:Kdo2-lipid IVA lauroyltransferase/acyltransferase
MKSRVEYAPVWILIQVLKFLPRPLARAMCTGVAILLYAILPRLRQVGLRNLELAFPEKSERERRHILRGVYISLGRLLSEIPKFSSYSRENVGRIAIYDGFENFERARARGKGVLFLTAHLGGWEIGSFVHSLHGNPLHVVMRALDNPYIDAYTRNLRTLHGNTLIDKDEFARGVLAALRKGDTVGVLMDTNMLSGEGEFVDFFGHPASTTTSVARLAMRTDAAVVPAFTIWDPNLGKYRIHFEPMIPTIRTGDDNADGITNTARYTKLIEDFIRRYPDQWLWVHRRWKTRPSGQPSLY